MKFALRKIASRNITLGAVCTATYLLARAGLLDGYRCTIHWENIASMREEYPNIQFTDDLFRIDRDRITCAGGQSSLDMMLKLISNSHGPKLAAQISEQFIANAFAARKIGNGYHYSFT